MEAQKLVCHWRRPKFDVDRPLMQLQIGVAFTDFAVAWGLLVENRQRRNVLG
jgi:hypothetical protein